MPDDALPLIVLSYNADDLVLDEGDSVTEWPLTPIVMWLEEIG